MWACTTPGRFQLEICCGRGSVGRGSCPLPSPWVRKGERASGMQVLCCTHTGACGLLRIVFQPQLDARPKAGTVLEPRRGERGKGRSVSGTPGSSAFPKKEASGLTGLCLPREKASKREASISREGASEKASRVSRTGMWPRDSGGKGPRNKCLRANGIAISNRTAAAGGVA